MKLLFLLLLALAMASSAEAQINAKKADSLFDMLEEKNIAIGSIAISRNGKLIYQRSFGKDQTAATRYRIGSISKMFTAVLVFQLIEEKKLRLTDVLARYFPQLPNAEKIAIAHLLGHRSGLGDFTKNTDYESWMDKPKTHAELLQMITNQKPEFEPGVKASYNNSNYLLLSYIIEKIEGKTYKELLTRRIVGKLRLRETYYGDHAGFLANEARSYKYFDHQWKPDRAAYLDNFSGAGAIISTPADMCKFIDGLFNRRLVNRRSLVQMKSMVDGYGMGMFPFGTAAHPGFGHNGKTEGFASSLQYYPDSGLSIAYCTNGEVYSKKDILDDVFSICYNLPYTLPSFKRVSVPAEVLNRYTGNYISGDSSIRVASVINGGQLILETRGQQFKTEAISDHKFWNVQYGFFFEFSTDGKRLLIKEVENVYELYRQ